MLARADGRDRARGAVTSRRSPTWRSDCAGIGEWMIDDASLDDRLAGSVPFLTMCAVAVAGWQLLRQARAAAECRRRASHAPSRWSRASSSTIWCPRPRPEGFGHRRRGAALRARCRGAGRMSAAAIRWPASPPRWNGCRRRRVAARPAGRCPAYVWDGTGARGVARIEAPPLDLLRGIDAQKATVRGQCRPPRRGPCRARHAAVGLARHGQVGAAARAASPRRRPSTPAASRWSRSRRMRSRPCRAVRRARGRSSAGSCVFIDDLGFEDGDGSRSARLLRIVARGRGRGAAGQCPAGGDLEPPRDRRPALVRAGRSDQSARRGRRPAGAGRPLRPVDRLPQLQPGRLSRDHRRLCRAPRPGLGSRRGARMVEAARRALGPGGLAISSPNSPAAAGTRPI